MSASEHLRDFGEAVADLDMVRFTAKDKNYANAASNICAAIKSGQRFYFPDSADVISGKRLSASQMDLVRLPYQTIAIACGHSSAAGGAYRRIVVASANPDNDREFCIYSAICGSATGGKWIAFPAFQKVSIPEGRDGYDTQMFVLPGLPDGYVDIGDLGEDTTAVLNLCLMLAMSNVAESVVRPSAKAAARRKAKGKRPLYDYKILVVDGQKWDGPSSGSPGSGVRSHLRRGHVRRIADGRAVWVRATFVHGSVAGFVGKDYSVK